MEIDVSFKKDDLHLTKTLHKQVVILDIFRTSSTITTALSHKAAKILPVQSPREAHFLKNKYPRALLGGELKGEMVTNFDLGNSPLEYTFAKIGQRPIILSSTNGTPTIIKAKNATRVYIGCFLNATAVRDKILQLKNSLLLACAGTQGKFSLEDTCCAGYLISLLNKKGNHYLHKNAQLALKLYQQLQQNLTYYLSHSQNGIALKEKGYEADLAYCCQRDCLHLVPVLTAKEEIIASS